MNRRLSTLPVLLVDCQTTGAHPRQGDLIELAWARTCAERARDRLPEATAQLVRLPRGQSLPPPIARLTGISDALLRDRGVTRRRLWARFRGEVYGRGGPGGIWTVAHVARFEERFLEDLHATFEKDAPFPLRFLCTHQIARRLLPDLPRRGLHALAGYFDTPLTEHKRALSHLHATDVVWRGLVRLLAERAQIDTLDALRGFLERPAPARGPRFRFPLPRERRLALSDRPGVYRFLSASGDVLYVGKAASLHRRVNSYYRKRRAADRLLELVSQARDVAVTETESALEAALLEIDEIKRRDPPYNRALRNRGQTVRYLSPDLGRAAATWSPACPLGPVPTPDLGTQLVALSRALGDPRADLTAVRTELGLEGVPFEPADAPRALEALRERLLEDHGRRDLSPAELLARGRRLWRQRLREIAAAGEDEDACGMEVQMLPEDADALEQEGPLERSAAGRAGPLDAQDLTDLLDWIPARAAHLVRRGRWLCHLSDALVWWASRDGSGAGRMLGWKGGRPVRAAATPAAAGIPARPPWEELGVGQAGPRRGVGLHDHAAYERLRVFNTELRRLIQQDRPVRLWIRRRRPLTERHLRRILPWV